MKRRPHNVFIDTHNTKCKWMQSTQHVDETRQRVVYITQDDCVRTLSSNCSTREMKSEKFPFCTSTCQQRQMIHCFTSLVVHIHNIIVQLFFAFIWQIKLNIFAHLSKVRGSASCLCSHQHSRSAPAPSTIAGRIDKMCPDYRRVEVEGSEWVSEWVASSQHISTKRLFSAIQGGVEGRGGNGHVVEA